MRYQRRTPFEMCGWRGASRTTLALTWSSEMAYVVGLTATDGCLVTGQRAINFKSSDRELVETYVRLLGRTNTVKSQRTRIGGVAFYTQFKDARLYEWFRTIGLSSRKSLTLGAIDVPDRFLLPLTRGLLDGDGTILNKTYRADTHGRPNYRWEYFQIRFVSASRPHIDWLRARLQALLQIDGYVATERARAGRHPMSVLRYGKGASVILARELYADPESPALQRKRAIWDSYAARTRLATDPSGEYNEGSDSSRPGGVTW